MCFYFLRLKSVKGRDTGRVEVVKFDENGGIVDCWIYMCRFDPYLNKINLKKIGSY